MEKCTFSLTPVPPFCLSLTAWVLRRRPENMVDRWEGGTYRRVIPVEDQPLEVAVEQAGSVNAPRLKVVLAGKKVPAMAKTHVAKALERLLGTRTDLQHFYRFASHNSMLKPLVGSFKGAKPTRFATVFEALINGIACQKLSLAFGILVLNRMAEAFSPAVTLNGVRAYAFPRPEDLAGLKPEDLRPLGINRQKARAMIELSSGIVEGRLDLESLENRPDDEAIEFLHDLRGIGRWTAEYVLLRGLGRLHIFPGDDVGARNSLQLWLGRRDLLDYDGVRVELKPWHPFAGLMYFHLLLDRLREKGYLGLPSREA